MTPRVAVVGCGGVGRKRAGALGPARLVACVDTAEELARDLASGAAGARSSSDCWSAVAAPDVDVVIVATPNDLLVLIAEAAVAAGKHVLVEKPAARTVAELDRLIHATGRSRSLVRVGFNDPYHPALLRARELCVEGAVGELMFLRGRYGHGGRVGYDREWRADPVRAGGGELLDQGVHLIDLARVLLGDFVHVEGATHTYFWRMPVEDNAFVHLRTARQQSRVAPRELHRVEEPLLAGDLRTRREVARRGPGRELRHRASVLLQDVSGDRTAGGNRLGVSRQGYFVADRVCGALEDIRLRRAPAAGLADARAVLAIVEQIYAHAADRTAP